MPRVNLSINQEMYDKIKHQAEIQGISVNNMIYSQLQKQYGDDEFDYIVALDCLKQEASEQSGYFSLWELPTFQEISNQGKKESPEQIRARLGKMFHDSVKNGQVWDVMIHKGKIDVPQHKSKRPGRAVIYAKKSEQRELLYNTPDGMFNIVEQHLQEAINQ
ncbi:hypothetical protein SAMN05421493_10380 [Pseudobutyrivibrio sp. 49]|uniref:hypothetical protein n=1 Tax=Pseudobutyrivibrio sp. 49 TaxID=1855344 RepID=UPI000884884F|nr:hypothetical protein [Pseudobutyrivibrio sp. 49]SDH69897.1 hypothetical protein SAMN05421493_10380 [Pseudobutyrivibrio sp. 49]